MSIICCSGDGEGRKDKGGGGGSRSKTKLCVTKLYVKDEMVCDTERWCVCVTKWCVKKGVPKMVFERWCATRCVTKLGVKWCVKDGV